MQSITILIATKNEEDFIFSRLMNIQNCQIPEDFVVSVAVLDNGSSDSTLIKVNDFKNISNMAIKGYQLPPVGKCGALFWAFQNIKSDFFLMTDANTIFSKMVFEDFCDAIRKSSDREIVWVGNGLGFPYESDVSNLDAKYLGGLQERHKIESKVGTFSGANGCCYGLSSSLVLNISNLPPTRNDDFIISVYAAARGVVAYAQNSYAYEYYSNSPLDLFRNKFRDSIGHLNAISWILKFVKPSPFAFKVIFSRVIFWFFPSLIAYIFFEISPVLFVVLLFVAFFYGRALCIKYLALILGLFFGLFQKAPTSWNPSRNFK